MTDDASLWALFASSFLAATLLPGGSELALFAVLKLHPGQYWTALAVATIGNTLGGMSSYLIGRVIPRGMPLKGLAAMQKYGSPVLLFSWVPVIGDPLCVVAGWMRINAWAAGAFMAIGKLARYLVIAAAAV
jgi:membrane protein YqaA with SNARE-associated domain